MVPVRRGGGRPARMGNQSGEVGAARPPLALSACQATALREEEKEKISPCPAEDAGATPRPPSPAPLNRAKRSLRRGVQPPAGLAPHRQAPHRGGRGRCLCWRGSRYPRQPARCQPRRHAAAARRPLPARLRPHGPRRRLASVLARCCCCAAAVLLQPLSSPFAPYSQPPPLPPPPPARPLLSPLPAHSTGAGDRRQDTPAAPRPRAHRGASPAARPAPRARRPPAAPPPAGGARRSLKETVTLFSGWRRAAPARPLSRRGHRHRSGADLGPVPACSEGYRRYTAGPSGPEAFSVLRE